MNTTLDRHSEEVSPLDRIFAVPMSWASILFLICLAAFLHLTNGNYDSWLSIGLLGCMALVYLAIVIEAIVHYRYGSDHLKQHWRYLLMPLLRLCPRDHVTGQRAWIPFLGWRKASDHLEHFLARLFGGPMIVIALMVLPVVGIEFLHADKLAAKPLYKLAIDSCGAFIWMAFVFELVVMISIVEKKFEYCRKNWIDIAVVILPLISYFGAAPLGRLLKLKQLGRTAKIYRMRGLALRGWRAIVALDVIDKVLRRTPEHIADKLNEQIRVKENELDHLRGQLESVEQKIKEQEEMQNLPGDSFQ